MDISREELIQIYIIEKRTMKEVAKLLGVHKSTIEKLCKELNIKKTTEQKGEAIKNGVTKKYGVSNISQLESIKQKKYTTNLKNNGDYGIVGTHAFVERTKKYYKENFGVTNASQVQEVKDKKKSTFRKHYNVDNYSQTPEFKKKFEDPEYTKEFFRKQIETKKLRGNCNTSKGEELLYKKLKTKYPDVIRRYSDERYPFPCDFYIPSLDLFIEYQGHWRHGGHPFDENNSEDIDKLKNWINKADTSIYYRSCVKAWTVLDPLKRHIAQKNNLNFKEIWKTIK